jgi:hypothetical protein
MKLSLIAATLFVASASAAGVGAVEFADTTYVGSDSLYNVTNQAILNSTLGNSNPNGLGPWNKDTNPLGDYTGGGSILGEAAMAAGRQETAPMTRMLKGGAGKNACAASDVSQASGIVIGVDALGLFASNAVINFDGGSLGNGPPGTPLCTAAVGGLAYDGANGNTMGFANWRDMLALLYGGLDRQTWSCGSKAPTKTCTSSSDKSCGLDSSNNQIPCQNVTDCNSTKRHTLVSNWGNLFENGAFTNQFSTLGTCTNGSFCNVGSTVPCSDASTCVKYPGLTHAFRRDDSSSTADLFSNLIGIQGASYDAAGNSIAGFSASASAVNGFGTTPYCNAMNWDVAEAKNTNTSTACGTNGDLHYQGPGGVPLPVAQDATQLHHVAPFTCGVQGYCTNGNTCTVGGAACADGSTCVNGQDNRCPTGQTVVSAAWGSTPYGTQNSVLSTSWQDNDPIRVPCLGNASGPTRSAEDVCNTDGRLGVVIAISALDFVHLQTSAPSWTGSPTTAPAGCGTFKAGYNVDCTSGFTFGPRISVYTCAPRSHGVLNGSTVGACPNNDGVIAAGCYVPVGPGPAGTTSSCQSNKSTSPGTCFFGGSQHGGTPCTADGRAWNTQVYNGDGNTPAYLTLQVPEVDANTHVAYTNSIQHAGAWGRIHQREVMQTGSHISACQLDSAAQQIGCLTAADPNSFGFDARTADVWEAADPLLQCGTGETVALRVHGLLGGASCTPNFPTSATTTYPLWRKLYFNSITGFARVAAAGAQDGGAGPAAEIALAEWESTAGNISPILSQYAFAPLPFSPNGTSSVVLTDGGAPTTVGNPFCEDFNEYLNGCAPDGGQGNANACAVNTGLTNTTLPGCTSPGCTVPLDPSSQAGNGADAASPVGSDAGAATTSTICGNGIIEQFEDCDPGTTVAQGQVGGAIPSAIPAGCGSCSSICRCSAF